MYKSPIEIIHNQIRIQQENDIMKAVQDYNIVVDKKELLKALRYDRGQYEKGYADGKREVVETIIARLRGEIRLQDEKYGDYGRIADGYEYAIEHIEDVVGDWIQETAIEELDLSTRTYHCLKRAGIHTVEELCKKTKLDIMRIRQLGTKSMQELLDVMKENGLKFKGE